MSHMQPPSSEFDAAQEGRSQIVRAATIVALAFVASRALGLVRDAVINYYFGVGSLEADAYVIANRLPEMIFYVIAGGALGSAFIPTFSAYFERDDAAGGWRLFSAITNLVILVTLAVVSAAILFTPQLIQFFFPALIAQEPALLPLTTRLMRVMLLSPLIFGVSGVLMGALNARQHFLLPAIAPILYNLGIIAGAVALAPDAMGLAYGTVAGALGHLAIQLPGFRRQKGRYTPILSLRDPGVQRVLRLMAPRILGLSFGQLNHILTQLLAQSMVIGSIRALDIGWRIMIMPQGVLGQALGIASFPTFSALAARKRLAEMRRILADTLRLIFFLGLPATVAMLMLRRPLIQLIYQRGDCDLACTNFIAWALLFYLLGMIALTMLEIISRAFYALGDTRTPVLAGFLQIVLMVIFGLWLSYRLFPALGWLPLGGLALGASLSNILETGLLLYWLRGRLGGIDGRHLLDGLWRMGAAGLVMGVVTWAVNVWLALYPSWWQLVAGGMAGGLVYLLLCYWMGVTELSYLLKRLTRRRS